MEFALDAQRYLSRINYTGKLSVDLDCLSALHRCHVMSVPFEATAIHFGQPIKLELDHIFDKVVLRRRGGFCYELNYLFSCLLRQIGFSTTIVSGEVYNEGSYGPPFDHLAIIVDLDGLWLLDVGFGSLFFEPIRIRPGVVQPDRDNDYMLKKTGPGAFCLLAASKGTKDFSPKYRFELQPRLIENFAAQCQYKQEAPTSHFVQNLICTLPTEKGRKTVKNNVLKVRHEGKITEQIIMNEADLLAILSEHFGFK